MSTNYKDVKISDYKKSNFNQFFIYVLYAYFLSNVIYIIIEVLFLSSISNQYPNWEQVEFWETAQGMYALIHFLMILVAYISGARWIYRSNYNIRCLGARDMRFSPGWSVGWYFIPIANLWKPYQAMKELYIKSSNSEILPSYFLLWWLLYITANILGNIAARALWGLSDTSTIENFIFASQIDILSTIFEIIVLFLFYKIVIAVNEKQKNLYLEISVPQN
tara:strand:+ start:166 stop:828 length:663 start_codon:yes stop_codon:yes gene_type:complete